MRLKSHSLMLGYREWDASMVKNGADWRLVLESIGPVGPVDYMKNGFRIVEASREEIEALIAGGYENRRALLRYL
jgi:hypothetical protein